MEILGFNIVGNLRLIPIHFLSLIPDGTELTSIIDKKVIKGKDYIDNDVRCGLLAYGFELKNN